MSILNTVILAIIQGITEYLPVSSTAHLLAAQRILGVEPSILFTVVLQLGTILASIFYFRRKIVSILKNSFTNVKTRNLKNDFGIWLLIGILPVMVIGFLVNDYLDEIYSNPYILVFTTVFFGFVFYFIEILYKNTKIKKSMDKVTLKDILYIGCAQVLSLIPGVSRSGSTISGGLAQKIEFKDSIEISFLMSIPILLAATMFELIKSLDLFTPELILNLIIGIIVAFLAGIVSIKITLGFLLKKGFLPFLIYRIIFGVVILIIVL